VDADTLRRLSSLELRVGKLETIELSPVYLPYSQRILNPFPLASSGGTPGDFGQPWAASIAAFYVSVFINTTNNGTNYWTISLVNQSGTPLASVNTSAISAGAWARLAATSITQPATSNIVFPLVATATLSPGAIYIAPAVAVFRTA
jgi:hypothetical protein